MTEPKPRTRWKPAAKGAGQAAEGMPKGAPAEGNPAAEDPPSRALPPQAALTAAPEPQEDAAAQRVAGLSRETGWLLVTAGAVGVILPGVLGTPLLILGAAVLWPGNGQRMERWLEKRSPRLFRKSLKQVDRFLDDLERRYPKR